MTADTLEEALKEYSRAHNKMKNKFCPIIKSQCRKDCVCFYKGTKPELRKDNKYHWYNPSCSHVLISGEIAIYS